MGIKHQYGEYISLLEAFARFGPVIVLGWKGNELDHNIWRETARRRNAEKREHDRFAAKERYRRLGLWFKSAIEAGEIELLGPVPGQPQSSANGLRKIDTAKISAWWAPTAFCGRLTLISVDEQLDGVIDESAPEVFVDPGVVDLAAQRYLSLDDEKFWSLSQAAYWIATRRFELVRDWKDLTGSDFEKAIQTDLLIPTTEARANIWDAVVNGTIEVSAVAEGSATEEVVSSSNLRRLKLETKYLPYDMHDLLIKPLGRKIAFYDPTVLREDVLKRWPATEAKSSGGPDRSIILRQLESGMLSIDEAGKMAGGDLVHEPSKRDFDPNAQRYWSIPMVLAGMTSDNVDTVIEQMNEWRRLVRFYVDDKGNRIASSRLAEIGKESGHRVAIKRLEPASFWGLMNSDEQDDIGDAWEILRERLVAGKVKATGINEGKKQREVIDAFKWPDLVAHGSDSWDGLTSECYTEPNKDLERFSDIQIDHSAVAALRSAFAKVPTAPRLTPEERTQCDMAARSAFDQRVRTWPRTGPFPTEDEDFDCMRKAIEMAKALPKNKTVPRHLLRVIRGEILSVHNYDDTDWRKRGQRKKTAK